MNSIKRLNKGLVAWRSRFDARFMIAIFSGLCNAGAHASAFEPDRDWFFATCKSLHNFKRTSASTAVPTSVARLNDQAIESINGFFDLWKVHGDGDQRKLAYILATARRESQGTWRPVREAPGCGTDETCREKAIGKLLSSRALASGRPVAENYAKPAWNGQRYYGRGYIQLTFPVNYKRADDKLVTGTKLFDKPDSVMEERIAQTILVRAMMEGWYGAKRPLSYWLNAQSEDWLNARNNVNPGSPNKAVTAESAKEINGCLRPAR
ncbi:glycoside hydrolase family 19 protein [Caballeronia sordidicola]|uniref:glycoside hydrolase family 19 protein n=1 Tax=Caballeronia sordidicola TaxID=196367 RepID=UPI0006920B8A|nr:glycoside hydrolase family 19 protein [Caballeronia sordidicola]